MKKENSTSSPKETTKDRARKVVAKVEEATEAVIKMANDVASNENVEKTINAAKDTAKTVKSKASKAAAAATSAASTAAKSATEAAKKTAAKKVNPVIFVQYNGKEVSTDFIQQKFEEEWLKDHILSELKTLEIYLKIEDNTAYCLVNSLIQIQINLN